MFNFIVIVVKKITGHFITINQILNYISFYKYYIKTINDVKLFYLRKSKQFQSHIMYLKCRERLEK